MKKLLFLLFVVTIHVFPQVGSLNSYATLLVKAPLSITTVNSTLDFGEIILAGSSLNPSIQPTQGAQFIIQGTSARSVTITFNNITLDNNQWVNTYGGTAGTLSFIPNLNDAAGNSIISGNSYYLSSGGFLGQLTINLGGSLNIPLNQPHGNYTGSFSFTVSY